MVDEGHGHQVLPYLSGDVWLEHILPKLAFEPVNLSSALCVSKSFAASSQSVWKKACFERWSNWATVSAEPDDIIENWKRQAELFALRETEFYATELLKGSLRPQKIVTDRHRGILTEWLCEVAYDWQLDSAVAFKAVSYLDYFLSCREIVELSSFQLVGLACLRAALGDAPKPTALTGKDKLLDPHRFAEISDNTYTSEQVEECTFFITNIIPEILKTSPNSKQFLRSFWHRITLYTGEVHPDEMHIYSIAAYLVQLSLLDVECSTQCASIVAAAALSLALGMFGKTQWPASLKCFSAYEISDLEPLRCRMAMLQATKRAPQLRHLWRLQCEDHDYPEFTGRWQKVLSLFEAPSQLLFTMAPDGAKLIPDGEQEQENEPMQVD